MPNATKELEKNEVGQTVGVFNADFIQSHLRYCKVTSLSNCEHILGLTSSFSVVTLTIVFTNIQ